VQAQSSGNGQPDAQDREVDPVHGRPAGFRAAAREAAIGFIGSIEPMALIQFGVSPIVKTPEKNATGSRMASTTAVTAVLEATIAASTNPHATIVRVPNASTTVASGMPHQATCRPKAIRPISVIAAAMTMAIGAAPTARPRR
jgi:hypothetical protein